MAITTIKIFPPIGVARLGNSPKDFFIGPEIPGLPVRPEGGFKDKQCRIKRQAARFRLYGYDAAGNFVKEVTEVDADIDWTVHLANQKAAFHGNDANRKIDPGARTLNGPLQSAKFNNGTFTIPGSAPALVDLGEIRTDDAGRLIVLGGFGRSFSPNGSGINSYLSNPNWTDDSADGPINARVILRSNGATINAQGGWVIIGPPKYAPEVANVINLHDRLFNYQRDHVNQANFPIPASPSFKNDIYPILKAAVMSNWVSGYPMNGPNPDPTRTDHHAAFNPASPLFQNLASNDITPGGMPLTMRTHTYNALRGTGQAPGNMPDLEGVVPGFNSNLTVISGGRRRTKLTPVQLDMMEKWKNGNFQADWGTYTPPTPSDAITPDGLTKAALENCVGAAFSPGIEAGKVLVPLAFGYGPGSRYSQDIYMANEPYRLNQANLAPGEVTRDMAVPWQADFAACTGCWWGTGADWWPAQRPRNAQVLDPVTNTYSYRQWDRGANSFVNMVNNWNNLGFILEEEVNGTMQLIEAERCDTGSIALLTPAIQFKNIPTGHGGTTRVTKRAIMFDVVTPGSNKNFTVQTAPANPNLSVIGHNFTVNATAANTSAELLIPIQFDASPAINAPISDSVVIRCVETGQDWRIPIKASVVPPKTAGVVLVLDISGSMNTWVNGQTRIDILRKASESFVQHMQDGDGIGIVVYSDTARIVQQITTLNAATRASTINTLRGPALNPGGYTSIGSGINKGRLMLNNNSAYDFEAMVVVTDGQENRAPFIRDVAANIQNNTFSVGIGQAQNISVAPLQALSNNTGGYFLITGTQDSTNQFRLQKYFLQILSSITNRNILLDPDGEVQPGEEHRIPFTISGAEAWIDVSLLHSDIDHLEFCVQAPSGQVITPKNVEKVENAEYTTGDHSAFYRLHAAISFGDGRFIWPGDWNVVLKGTGDQPTEYSVVIHGHSEVNFDAQANMKVGGEGDVRISATITEHDTFFPPAARVWGELTNPQGIRTKIELEQDEPGHFSTMYHPKVMGHFDLRLRAAGETKEGTSFMREKHLVFNLQHIEPEKPEQNPLDPDHPVTVDPSGDGYMVLGDVDLPDGIDPSELHIRVYDKDARSKTELGQSKIDANGHYRVPYLEKDYRKTKKEMGGADLMVWVYKDDEVIHKVKTQYDSPRVCIIDFALDAVL